MFGFGLNEQWLGKSELIGKIDNDISELDFFLLRFPCLRSSTSEVNSFIKNIVYEVIDEKIFSIHPSFEKNPQQQFHLLYLLDRTPVKFCPSTARAGFQCWCWGSDKNPAFLCKSSPNLRRFAIGSQLLPLLLLIRFRLSNFSSSYRDFSLIFSLLHTVPSCKHDKVFSKNFATTFSPICFVPRIVKLSREMPNSSKNENKKPEYGKRVASRRCFDSLWMVNINCW